MGAQRLSLSSPAFAGRVKKFDTYQQTDRRVQPTPHRATLQKQLSVPSIQPVVKSALVQPMHLQARQKPAALSQPYKAQQIAKLHPLKRVKPTDTIAKKSNSKQPVATPQQQNSSKQHSPSQNQAVQQLAMKAVESSPATNKSIIADQFQLPSGSMPQKKRKQSKLQKAMNIVAVVVFLFASGVSIQTLLTNKKTQEVLGQSQGAGQPTGSDPSEEKVSEDDIINYQVGPEMPRYLRLPTLGVFARIKHTGLTPEGAVDAPANIYDTSWYDRSARPGDATGSSLILGHVQGRSAPGVFKEIEKLKTGDRFSVEKGNGDVIEYEVTKGEEFSLDNLDMREILSAIDPAAHDLKLMTCSGSYDAETESYNSRYVVYAKTVF